MRAYEDKKLLKKKLKEYRPTRFLVGSVKRSDKKHIRKIRSEHIRNVCIVKKEIHRNSEGGTSTSIVTRHCAEITGFIFALNNNQFVRVIDLRNNASILKYDVIELLNLITYSPRLPLECLVLSGELDWDILDAISTLLIKKISLEFLDLSRCKFKHNLRSNKARSALNRFGSAVYGSHLRYLSLPHTEREYVSDFIFQFIQNFDPRNTRLQEFYIKYSFIRMYVDGPSRRLMTKKLNLILARNRTINFIRNTIFELKDLEALKGNRLDLSGKVIKASDFSRLVSAIIENKNLLIEELNLNGSLKDFSPDAEIAYLEGLIKLITQKHSLRILYISDSLFTDNDIISKLAYALAQNYRLNKLVLEKSSFTVRGLKQFVNILNENKSLTDIKFSFQDQQQIVDKTISKTLKTMVARNRSNLSKLQKAIKRNSAEQVQLALKSGANPYACGEYQRNRMSFSRRRQSRIIELEESSAAMAKGNEGKEIVFNNETINNILSRAQRQIQRSVKNSDELIINYFQKKSSSKITANYQLAMRYLMGQGVKKNKEKAYNYLKLAATLEHTESIYRLGIMNYHGIGCESNLASAIRHLEKVATKGHPLALYQLGMYYCEKSKYTLGREYLDQAYQAGFLLANQTLRFVVEDSSNSVQSNLHSTKEWWAVNSGFIESNLYSKKVPLTFNPKSSKSLKYFLKTNDYQYTPAHVSEDDISKISQKAQKGDKEAKYKLFWHYYSAKGVTYDAKKALYWLKGSAKQGYQEAQYLLGMSYYCGDLTSVDYSQAYDWCLKAALSGHKKAESQINIISIKKHYQLAMDCLDGATNDNKELAARHLAKAAGFGYIRAYYDLGMLYYPKKDSLNNLGLAIKYLSLACEHGYAKAYYQLGVLHIDKEIMLFYNINTAIKYFEKAYQLGYKRAKSQLKQLKAKITPITSSDENSSCGSSSGMIQKSNKS